MKRKGPDAALPNPRADSPAVKKTLTDAQTARAEAQKAEAGAELKSQYWAARTKTIEEQNAAKAKAGIEKATKEEKGEKQRLAREDERRKTMEEQNAAKAKAAPIMI